MELDNLLPFLVRWIHLFAGVVWIGILYYFNFVQTEYFKVADPSAKASAISKLLPNALSGSALALSPLSCQALRSLAI